MARHFLVSSHCTTTMEVQRRGGYGGFADEKMSYQNEDTALRYGATTPDISAPPNY